MSTQATPRLTPDGKPTRERRDTDRADRSDIDKGDDPAIPGDAAKPAYGNTGEAKPDKDGLVREGDQREPPLI